MKKKKNKLSSLPGEKWCEFRRKGASTCCYAVKERQHTDGLPPLCHDGRVKLWWILKSNDGKEEWELKKIQASQELISRFNYSQNLGRGYLRRSAAGGWASRSGAPADRTRPLDSTCNSSTGPLWWQRGQLLDQQGGPHTLHRSTWTQHEEM